MEMFPNKKEKGHQQPRAPPRPHIRDMAPAKVSFLLAAMVVLITSSGYYWLLVIVPLVTFPVGNASYLSQSRNPLESKADPS